jgi:hypothetical protein
LRMQLTRRVCTQDSTFSSRVHRLPAMGSAKTTKLLPEETPELFTFSEVLQDTLEE